MYVYPLGDLCTYIPPFGGIYVQIPPNGGIWVYIPPNGVIRVEGGSGCKYKGNRKMDVHEFEPKSLKVKYYYSVDNSAMNWLILYITILTFSLQQVILEK